MSKRSTKLLLEDILEAIESIIEYTEGIHFEEFDTDRKTKDAVVRNFEVIGEAANKLHNEILMQYPDVDWSGVIGFRHKLIHDYFGVDYTIIWSIIQVQLPKLRAQIQEILAKLE